MLKARLRRASRKDKYISIALNKVIIEAHNIKPGRTYNFLFEEGDGRTVIATGRVPESMNRVVLNGHAMGYALTDPSIEVGIGIVEVDLLEVQWVAGQ